MHNKELAEIYNKAADYLDRHGWCQGVMYKKGKSCLVGSIYRVVQSDAVRVDAANTLACLNKLGSASLWNDESGRR